MNLFRARCCGRRARRKGHIVPSVPLPENASLEHLKKQAKLVQNLVAATDDGALGMVDEFHPRLNATEAAQSFKRSDAQLVIARLYGFPSWSRLRDHLRGVEEWGRPDTADNEFDHDVDHFVAMACVSYSQHNPIERAAIAHRLLEENPNLSSASLAAMAVTGNHRALAEKIEQKPNVVDELCGPNRWPPLLYATFSRIDVVDPAFSTLAVATLLLDCGADPNAGFLWHGLVPPFTAITGALGRGEADQPPHPSALKLARKLLEAGADANDGQALYNNGLAGSSHDDPAHLQLLVEFGLGTDTKGPWYERFGPRLTAPDELLYDELEVAAHRGLPNRMRYLLSLGLDVDRPVGRSQKTPRQLAERKGHLDVLAIIDGSPGQTS